MDKLLDERLAFRFREAAQMCGVSAMTVKRWVRLGIVTATRVEPEGVPLIEVEELRRVLREGRGRRSEMADRRLASARAVLADKRATRQGGSKCRAS